MNFSIQLHCGTETYKTAFAHSLMAQGIKLCKNATLQLLLDEPVGWASLPHPKLDLTRCVIASDNVCVTYQLELLERNPAALVGLRCCEALVATLQLVHNGTKLYPKLSKTPLTPVERRTVHYIAQGYTNKEVAKLRGVGEGHIKNTLSNIYAKLKLRSRVQIAHYYYGHWHLIKGWTPPYPLY